MLLAAPLLRNETVIIHRSVVIVVTVPAARRTSSHGRVGGVPGTSSTPAAPWRGLRLSHALRDSRPPERRWIGDHAGGPAKSTKTAAAVRSACLCHSADPRGSRRNLMVSAVVGSARSQLTRSPDSGPPVVGVRRPTCWAGGQDQMKRHRRTPEQLVRKLGGRGARRRSRAARPTGGRPGPGRPARHPSHREPTPRPPTSRRDAGLGGPSSCLLSHMAATDTLTTWLATASGRTYGRVHGPGGTRRALNRGAGLGGAMSVSISMTGILRCAVGG